MTTAWAHLPNAAHIDRVLASLRESPEVWTAARTAARDASYDAAYDAAYVAAYDAAYVAARVAAWDAAYSAARGALLALIAWDDSAVFLEMPPDAVRLVAASGHHPAILLLPAAIVFSKPSVSNHN